MIQNQGHCIQARPVRAIKLVKCPSIPSSLFKWRWLPDGQIQNIETGLCIDTYAVSYTNPMRLSRCSYRKSFQKFHCNGNVVYAAHAKKFFVWSFSVRSGVGHLAYVTRTKRVASVQVKAPGATGQLCYLGPRGKLFWLSYCISVRRKSPRKVSNHY